MHLSANFSPHPLPQSGAESLQWGGRRCHPSAPSTWMWLAPPLELLLHHLPLHPLTGPGSATQTMTKRMSRALQWLGTHPWSWLRPTSHLLMGSLPDLLQLPYVGNFWIIGQYLMIYAKILLAIIIKNYKKNQVTIKQDSQFLQRFVYWRRVRVPE